MTVKEFLDKYNEARDKVEFVSSSFKKIYIPYATKVSDCERIIKTTNYTNTEPNLYKTNTPSRKMLFLLTLINRYTDIDIDFTNALEEYDMLCSIDLDKIYGCFAETEYELQRYEEILSDMTDDFYDNERSMIGYLDTKLASFNILKEEFEKVIEENLSV
jgi:hypothetical protein